MAVGISDHEREWIAMESIVINHGTLIVPEGCIKINVVNVMPTREQFEASLQGGSPFIKIESDPEPKTETWRDRAIKDPLF